MGKRTDQVALAVGDQRELGEGAALEREGVEHVRAGSCKQEGHTHMIGCYT